MTLYGLLAVAGLSILSLGASSAEAKPNRTNPAAVRCRSFSTRQMTRLPGASVLAVRIGRS